MSEEFIDYLSDEDKKRLATMLMLSRAESGMSQEKIALELGIARKTVQNWEKGTSAPTFPQAISWFRVLNVAAMPYLLQFMFPEMEGTNSKDHDDKLRKELMALIEIMPPEGIRQLLFLLYGDHGSSPRAMINLATAHLQCPLHERYTHACTILNDYKLASDRGEISRPDHIQPDIPLLERALAQSREAVVNNKDSYMIV